MQLSSVKTPRKSLNIYVVLNGFYFITEKYDVIVDGKKLIGIIEYHRARGSAVG